MIIREYVGVEYNIPLESSETGPWISLLTSWLPHAYGGSGKARDEQKGVPGFRMAQTFTQGEVLL